MGKTWKCTSIWKAKSDERFIFFRLNQPCCFFYIIVPFMLPFTVEETNIPCCLCIYSPTVYVMSVFQPPLSIRFALIYSAWDLFVFSEYLKDDSTLKHKICLFYKAKKKQKTKKSYVFSDSGGNKLVGGVFPGFLWETTALLWKEDVVIASAARMAFNRRGKKNISNIISKICDN